MKEKTLLKISLICSIFGILLLFLLSNTLEVNKKVISEIDETDLGQGIKIDGVITNINKKGTVTLIEIAQLEKMDIVVFNSNLTLLKGDYVEVTGKPEEYNGNIELIADKIVLK